MNFLVFKANIYKYFITLLRAYPKSFFIGHLMSVFFTVLFADMMYRGLFSSQVDASFVHYANTNNYIGYIVIGVMVYTFTVNTLLNVSRSLITERRMGTLESVMMAPYHRGLYFLSTMCAQTLHNGWELVFSIPILLLFKVHFQSFDVLSIFIALILTLFAFLGLSLLLANVMLYTRDTYISQNTLFSIIFLICGINFPVEYLPKYLATIGNLIPVTHSVNLLRGILLSGKTIWDNPNAILYLLGEGIVYCTIGFILLSRVEKIALEHIDG